MKIRRLLTLIIALTAMFAIQAGRPILSAKLDSTKMLMGNVTTLRLEVTQDKGVKGEFPLFRNFGERGFVTLLGDTIELSRDMKIDTAEASARRIKIDYQVPVQVFDSGMYKLPEFVFVCGADTARSGSLQLEVVPVKVKANDPISPLTDVAEPENPSIFDALPDWIVNYWWLILLILAVIGVGVWLFMRYRSKGVILLQKAQTPPYELAMQQLAKLKGRNLWQTGREKEFYTILTYILRNYLDGRFGIRAMEMTSREIMETLANDSSLRESRSMMRQILDMADFVKFAMVRPLPDDNVKAFDNAVAFVEATKPVEKPADTVDAAEHSDDTKRLSIDAVGIEKKHRFRIVDKLRKRYNYANTGNKVTAESGKGGAR